MNEEHSIDTLILATVVFALAVYGLISILLMLTEAFVC